VEPGLTSGGATGASGGIPVRWQTPRILTAGAFVAFGLVYVFVNATSLIDERQVLGQPIVIWQPWVLEMTSFLAWLTLIPAILWLADRYTMPGRPFQSLMLHLFATIPISLLHSGAMFVMRKLAYAVMDESYRWSSAVLDTLIYEYRKDAITYASLVIVFLMLKRLAALPQTNADNLRTSLIEVRDGAQTIWIKPEEIDWIEAAGNYVELHGSFGTKLARRTLTEMETELLNHGFVRVHRSRLARKTAIAKMATRQSGDFEITLRCGTAISGSRRYRGNL
jgi:LytTr DNA-binding domain